jgi:hypothetical protein
MTKSFTGEEFVKAFEKGRLKQPLVLTGMTKQAETGSNAILFSMGVSCGSWIRIPVEMIDKVEHVATINCRDHEHPYVSLYLKEPPVDNTEARVLADLLRKSQLAGNIPTVWQGFTRGAVIARAAGSGQTQPEPGKQGGCLFMRFPICLKSQDLGHHPYPPLLTWDQIGIASTS